MAVTLNSVTVEKQSGAVVMNVHTMDTNLHTKYTHALILVIFSNYKALAIG